MDINGQDLIRACSAKCHPQSYISPESPDFHIAFYIPAPVRTGAATRPVSPTAFQRHPTTQCALVIRLHCFSLMQEFRLFSVSMQWKTGYINELSSKAFLML